MVAAKADSPRKTKAQAAQKDTEVEPSPPMEEQVSTDEEPERPEPKVFGPPPGMYPADAELFSYTSKATGETIWFPMKFEQPKFSQIWETYDKPWHVQTWEYMRWAKIPKAMQRLAARLGDVAPDEYLDLFNGWLSAIGGFTLGE
jgi:hypothetical protein